MANVNTSLAAVQQFSLDLALRGVHARLRGYTLLLALWLLTRSKQPETFELTVEEMAMGVGFSAGTVRLALKELNAESAFIRDSRVRWRYRWNAATLDTWAREAKSYLFTTAVGGRGEGGSADLLITGLPGMLAEALSRARVQKYKLVGPGAQPEDVPRNERGDRFLAWLAEHVRFHEAEHSPDVVVRAVVDCYLAGGSPRVAEERHPMGMLVNGFDWRRIDADLPGRLRAIARERRAAVEMPPPRDSLRRRALPEVIPSFAPARVQEVLAAVGGAR